MMTVVLLIIFSLIIIMYFIWKIKDRKKKERFQISYKKKWNRYDIWDDDL